MRQLEVSWARTYSTARTRRGAHDADAPARAHSRDLMQVGAVGTRRAEKGDSAFRGLPPSLGRSVTVSGQGLGRLPKQLAREGLSA